MDEKHSSNELEVQKQIHEKEMEHIKSEAELLHDRVSERKLLLKTDLHVVPILFLLFLCAFVDRYVNDDLASW